MLSSGWASYASDIEQATTMRQANIKRPRYQVCLAGLVREPYCHTHPCRLRRQTQAARNPIKCTRSSHRNTMPETIGLPKTGATSRGHHIVRTGAIERRCVRWTAEFPTGRTRSPDAGSHAGRAQINAKCNPRAEATSRGEQISAPHIPNRDVYTAPARCVPARRTPGSPPKARCD